jgi:hypothetical protein
VYQPLLFVQVTAPSWLGAEANIGWLGLLPIDLLLTSSYLSLDPVLFE